MICTAEFHDIEDLYKGDYKKKRWVIKKGEAVDGNETTPFYSLKRYKLGESVETGELVLTFDKIQHLSLPTNPQILHDIGVTCIEISGIPYEPNSKNESVSQKKIESSKKEKT